MEHGAHHDSVADSVARALQDLGVDTIFCITGAGNIALLDALSRSGGFRLVFMHHEQAVVMAASGYARVTGRLGVAVVTTGGGTANAFTGILSAHMDSIPVLVIGGNESSGNLREMINFRALGVQGFDAVTTFLGSTKMSQRLLEPHDSFASVLHAVHVALTGRRGPVFLEIPMDIQRLPVPTSLSDVGSGAGTEPLGVESNPPKLRPQVLTDVLDTISSAERPLIYFGAGVRAAEAVGLAQELIEAIPIPFLLSWSAIDLFDNDHPLNAGRAGIYGDRAGNIIVQRCDLMICVGTRLAIPQVGYDRNDFARNADVWVVDVDLDEIAKHPERVHTIKADARDFLSSLRSASASGPARTWDHWREEIASIWEAFPRGDQIGSRVDPSRFVHSFDAISRLSDLLPEDAIVVTDVGAGLLTGHYGLKVKLGQRVFTSQGLGEMGFGLAGAIGAAIAAPTRPVLCLNTDGGVMFNLQELQTIDSYRLPIKLVVFNNSGYGMIRSSQDTLFDGRRLGVDPGTGIGFPDFEKLADCFNIEFRRCSSESDLERSLSEMLRSESAFLLELVMDPEQRYLPKLATIKLADGSLTSPPIEDMDPRVAPMQLSKWLEGRADPAPTTSSTADDLRPTDD